MHTSIDVTGGGPSEGGALDCAHNFAFLVRTIYRVRTRQSVYTLGLLLHLTGNAFAWFGSSWFDVIRCLCMPSSMSTLERQVAVECLCLCE